MTIDRHPFLKKIFTVENFCYIAEDNDIDIPHMSDGEIEDIISRYFDKNKEYILDTVDSCMRKWQDTFMNSAQEYDTHYIEVADKEFFDYYFDTGNIIEDTHITPNIPENYLYGAASNFYVKNKEYIEEDLEHGTYDIMNDIIATIVIS